MHVRVLIVAFVALLPARLALAQVSVDPRALDQLGGATPAPEAAPPPAHHPVVRHPVHQTPASHAAAAHAPPTKTAVAKPKPPALPAAPPAVAVIPPPSEQPPPHPTTPPPLPTVSASAPGDASKIDNGLRVTFGPGRSDLNPATDQALRVLADQARNSPEVSFNVTAFAPGKPEDPSTPRRLSLSRALAARSVLINDGIPSTRIYVRAMGATGETAPAASGGAPPDRVDVTVARDTGTGAAVAHPASAPAPAAKPPPKT